VNVIIITVIIITLLDDTITESSVVYIVFQTFVCLFDCFNECLIYVPLFFPLCIKVIEPPCSIKQRLQMSIRKTFT